VHNLTSVDKNREAMRKAGVLKPLLAVLDLPLPASEAIVMVALRALSNLAVDGMKTNEREENTDATNFILLLFLRFNC
jgi:Armadillo/beta-catenin-like repeat